MQAAAEDGEREREFVRELQKIGAALEVLGVRNAQSFVVGTELVPFAGTGHGGALAIEGKIAEGEGYLGNISQPDKEECVSCVAWTTKQSGRLGPPPIVDCAADCKRDTEEKTGSNYDEAP